MRFLCFPVLSGSAEAQVIWGGTVKHLLIAYFIINISTKKTSKCIHVCQSYSKRKVGRFLRHGVYTAALHTKIQIQIYHTGYIVQLSFKNLKRNTYVKYANYYYFNFCVISQLSVVIKRYGTSTQFLHPSCRPTSSVKPLKA